MKKILITGSKGFIGSEMLSYLQSKGYDALGINIDIRDKEVLRPYFKNTEFVIHAAGQVKDTKNQEDYYTVNVLGTKNVVELCMKNNCRLIHLSSIAVEGAYGASKQESQRLVEEYSHKGLKVVILRLCAIYRTLNNSKRRITQYPLPQLVEDIENIIKFHNFNEYEKPINLY